MEVEDSDQFHISQTIQDEATVTNPDVASDPPLPTVVVDIPEITDLDASPEATWNRGDILLTTIPEEGWGNVDYDQLTQLLQTPPPPP